MFTNRTTSLKSPVTAVPLLRYWTWRYAMILLIMLLGIGLFGIYWIRENTMEQQFAVLEARTALLADSYSKAVEAVPMTKVYSSITVSPATSTNSATAAVPASIVNVMPAVPLNHIVQIYDEGNKQVSGTESKNMTLTKLPVPALQAADQKETREILDTQDGTWLRVGVPYYENQSFGGTYYVSTRLNDDLVQTYIMIMVSIGVITLGGWGIVYVLSRSLTHPLRQLAVAAQQVSDGNYRPELPDVTRIKEAEISQLVHSFDEMARRLGQLERMRTDLLAGVSHELRTPVTSIRGMIQAVKDGVVTGNDADEFMQISMDEAKRLQSMVNDLLDFTSMEAGAIAMESSPVNLSAFMTKIVSQLNAVPVFSTIDVAIADLPEELFWIGDKAHLKQIMLNLLNNSAAAGATSIEIRIEQLDKLLAIEIIDNGKGIPPEEAPFIFERYYRGDSKRKKKHGLGLGLPICRMLAQAHGGNVEFLDTTARGTVFRVTLQNPAE